MENNERIAMLMREELEADLNTRVEEINELYNNISDKIVLKKSFILLLYAHFEGFVKNLLQTYIKNLNLLQLKRKDVKSELTASSMKKIFESYEKKDNKKIFKEENIFTELHKHERRCIFLEKIEHFLEAELILNDNLVNTESNIGTEVIRKNLYSLGIEIELKKEVDILINTLLNRRNDIGHNGNGRLISDDKIESLKKEIINFMSSLIEIIFYGLKDKKYLK